MPSIGRRVAAPGWFLGPYPPWPPDSARGRAWQAYHTEAGEAQQRQCRCRSEHEPKPLTYDIKYHMGRKADGEDER